MNNEIIFDMHNPNPEMFTRDEEVPKQVVIAVHPEYTYTVRVAHQRVVEALTKIMGNAKTGILMMAGEKVEMEEGDTVDLTPDTLIISLTYPTVKSKLINLELAQPSRVTIHQE